MTARRLPAAVRRDEGFTVVELVTALAVFGVLMTLVAAAMLSGMQSVRAMTTRSQVQVEQQTAIEWVQRTLRYTDNPYTALPLPAAITEATPTSVTVHTFAGLGTTDRVAYKARFSVQADGLVSEVWTPAYTNGVPAYTAPAMRRVLVRPADSGLPTLRFTYYARSGAALVPITGAGTGGALTTAQAATVAAIRVEINGGDGAIPVIQTIELVNPLT